MSVERAPRAAIVISQDDEHLKLLAIFHYVVGGLAGMVALFPLVHLIMGLFMVIAPHVFEGEADPAAAVVGWIFVIFAATFIGIGWAFAGCLIAAGRFLTRRKHRLFCLVIGGVECIFMPFGTVLGVFTIIVLMRESVVLAFEGAGNGN